MPSATPGRDHERAAITASTALRTRRSRSVLELAVLAVITIALYAVLWPAQRSLFLAAFQNGEWNRAGIRPDVDAARVSAVVVWVVGPLLCAAFLWLVLRAPVLQRAGLGRAALALPALAGLALLLLPPTLSDDVLSYLSHGYLAATSGANPYVDSSRSVADVPYGRLLLNQGWTAAHPATPYGPVWTLLERTVYQLSGNDVALGVLLMKLPAALSVIGIGVLVHRFLRTHRPASALRGCLLFVANPLVLIELAGDGHNDGLLALLVLGALLLTIRKQVFFAVLLLGIAVLVKTSVLPFAVPIAVHLFVQRRSLRRPVLQAVLAAAAVAALGVLLVAPFWAGAATLTGLRAGGTLYGWSVAGALRHAAEFSTAALAVPAPIALLGAQGVLALLLAAGTLIASRGAGTTAGLLRCSVTVSLVVLVLLPVSWPWYATLPVALLPLAPDGLAVVAIGVFAIMSRLGAPLADAAGAGLLPGVSLYSVVPFLVQTVPGLTGLTLERLRGTPVGGRLVRRMAAAVAAQP